MTPTFTVDQVRLGIRMQESGGNYQAVNPKSAGGKGAWGAYQYIDSTWNWRYGVLHASQATDAQQDAACRSDLLALYAMPELKQDWDRVIASWFGGPEVGKADKKTWGVPPAGTAGYNPEVQQYVDGVRNHIANL